MKKILLALAISTITTTGFAQWNQSGNNISTTSNVGIGTTSPQYKLDVNGDNRINGILNIGNTIINRNNRILNLLSNNTSGAGSTVQFDFNEKFSTLIHSRTNEGTSSDLYFYTAYNSKNNTISNLSLKGNGNVGIGTESPQYKLHVNGDIRGTNMTIPHNQYIGATLEDNFKYKNLTMGHYALTWIKDPSFIGASTLWQSGYGGIKYFTRGQYRMGINFDGNVGIGTENPQYKLDVDGDIKGSNNLIIGSRVPNSTSKLIIVGSNDYHNNARDISFEFAGAGKSIIRAYRGQSWDNYLQFLTTHTNATPAVRMHISSNGNVGIGTENPKNLLDVNGTIRAKEVKIELENWSDFVFDKDYKLLSLNEVEAHINEHKHLPNIPSEKQVREDGVNLAEMQAKLLQKIEELTLYVIDLKKENIEIKKENQEIKKQLGNIKNK